MLDFYARKHTHLVECETVYKISLYIKEYISIGRQMQLWEAIPDNIPRMAEQLVIPTYHTCICPTAGNESTYHSVWNLSHKAYLIPPLLIHVISIQSLRMEIEQLLKYDLLIYWQSQHI